MDKLINDFLWGSTQEKRKLHMVNWSTVTLLKHLGGLGIMEMRTRNEAILVMRARGTLGKNSNE